MKAFSFVLLIFIAGMFAGCSKPSEPKSAASTGSSAAPLTSTPQRTASDAALVTKVKGALASDDGLKSLNIDVDANAGVVTLKGKVDNDEMKQRAQQAAQAVQGVTWVQNQISVAPKAG
jgi:hyperosmotically inducible periplasmic protein